MMVIAEEPRQSGLRAESYQEWNRRSGHAETRNPLRRDPSADVWRLLVQLGVMEAE